MENCISNINWENCEKQFSWISTIGLKKLMLPKEIRQTENTIVELKEKVSENYGKYFSSEEEVPCINLNLRKEVKIERKERALTLFHAGSDITYSKRGWAYIPTQ